MLIHNERQRERAPRIMMMFESGRASVVLLELELALVGEGVDAPDREGERGNVEGYWVIWVWVYT